MHRPVRSERAFLGFPAPFCQAAFVCHVDPVTMPAVLNFGHASTLQLNLQPQALLAQCSPRSQPLDDVEEAALGALQAPLGYPPIEQATVPGDRVAVALANDLPCAGPLAAGAVRALVEAGVEPQHIAIVRTKAAAEVDGRDLRDALAPQLARQVHWGVHDPADARELAYLAASPSGEPIHLNRTLCDADLVLLLGCLRLKRSLGYRGLCGGLYPAFSDEATIRRWQVPADRRQAAARRKEAAAAGWQLGVRLMLQAIPGGGERILHVVAGDADAVAAEGARLCELEWSFSVPRRAGLVVATIEGGPREQTWDNIGRALAAASRVVDVDGAVALCTDLELAPGPALMRLAQARSLQAAHKKMRHDDSADAVAAVQMAKALARGPVYLLSRLQDEVTEELGIAPVSDADEIARLVSRAESCILMPSAQYAVPIADDE